MPANLLHRLSSTRGQIHLSVKINNVSQLIYAVHQTGSQETEAWIACGSGQTYTVHLDCQEHPKSMDFRGHYPDLNAELRLDGVMTEELTSVYDDKGGVESMGSVVWKGTYVRKGYRRPFIFRSPVSLPSCKPGSIIPLDRTKPRSLITPKPVLLQILTDPVANIDPNLTEPLGTIRVEIRRVEVSRSTTKQTKRDSFKRIWFDPNVPENAKKGVLSNLTE